VDPESINKVIEEYSKCPADGFLIWLDDFSEVSVSETILRRYKEFLYKLGNPGKPIIAMHGSYFSIALRDLRHYLNTKINEYKKCASSPIAEIINELKTSQSIAEKIKSHPFIHLIKWMNVLSG
jgi:hypothetical protein